MKYGEFIENHEVFYIRIKCNYLYYYYPCKIPVEFLKDGRVLFDLDGYAKIIVFPKEFRRYKFSDTLKIYRKMDEIYNKIMIIENNMMQKHFNKEFYKIAQF